MKQDLKRCPSCKTEKSIMEFGKDTNAQDGLCTYCKKCRVKYYQDHKKKIIAYSKEYYQNHKAESVLYQQKHKTEFALYNKQYYQAHKTEIATYKKQYQQDNKEKLALQKKQYYQDNKEKTVIYLKQYNQDHKEELSTYHKQYRQTEAGKATRRRGRYKRRVLKYKGIYEVFDSKEIFERDNYICQLCGKKTKPDYKNPNHPLYPNLDHIIPLSKGGEHTRKNTQCSCRQCNIEKNNKIIGQLRLFG